MHSWFWQKPPQTLPTRDLFEALRAQMEVHQFSLTLLQQLPALGTSLRRPLICYVKGQGHHPCISILIYINTYKTMPFHAMPCHTKPNQTTPTHTNPHHPIPSVPFHNIPYQTILPCIHAIHTTRYHSITPCHSVTYLTTPFLL